MRSPHTHTARNRKRKGTLSHSHAARCQLANHRRQCARLGIPFCGFVTNPRLPQGGSLSHSPTAARPPYPAAPLQGFPALLAARPLSPWAHGSTSAGHHDGRATIQRYPHLHINNTLVSTHNASLCIIHYTCTFSRVWHHEVDPVTPASLSLKRASDAIYIYISRYIG